MSVTPTATTATMPGGELEHAGGAGAVTRSMSTALTPTIQPMHAPNDRPSATAT